MEFESATIKQRVHNTMAAEFAVLATCVDRYLYARALAQSLLYGEPDFVVNWRNDLKTPGIVLTDATCVHDHLHKTGSIPKERQMLLDLLTVRDLVEDGVIDLRWVATAHMLADMLTKGMPITRCRRNLMRTTVLC